MAQTQPLSTSTAAARSGPHLSLVLLCVFLWQLWWPLGQAPGVLPGSLVIQVPSMLPQHTHQAPVQRPHRNIAVTAACKDDYLVAVFGPAAEHAAAACAGAAAGLWVGPCWDEVHACDSAIMSLPVGPLQHQDNKTDISLVFCSMHVVMVPLYSLLCSVSIALRLCCVF